LSGADRPQKNLTIGENESMRVVIALIVIVYLVGVGVALSPTIRDKWNSASASELAKSIAQALPEASEWPVRAYRSIAR
jgi:hypothetical protein